MRAEAKQRSFYKSGKLQLLLHADSSCTQTLRELEVPLAITHTAGTGLSNVTCLAVDGLSTALSTEGRLRLAYSPYGYAGDSPEQSVAFTGQRWDPISECYLLGAGRVPYSPVLMRRTVSDPFSPFGKGGINSYMYCNADPINYTDPSGRKRQWRWFGWFRSPSSKVQLKNSNIALSKKNTELNAELVAVRAELARTKKELSEDKFRSWSEGYDVRSKSVPGERGAWYELGWNAGRVFGFRTGKRSAYYESAQVGFNNGETDGTTSFTQGSNQGANLGPTQGSNQVANLGPTQSDIRTSPEPGPRAPDV